jgi:hypothetical protein
VGARHHYVPRVLQKGFASKVEGEKVWTIQATRGSPPIEVSTKDSAVGKFFYGKDKSVEKALSELEGRLASILRNLFADEDPDKYATQLSHLLWVQAFRTKAMRENMVGAFRRVLESAFSEANRFEFFSNLRLQALANIDALIGEEAGTLPLRNRIILEEAIKVPSLRDMLADGICSHLANAGVVDFISRMLTQGAWSQKFEETAQNGQISGLTKLLETENAPEHVTPARWYVSKYENHAIILGDIVTVFYDVNLNGFGPGRVGSEWNWVALPISHNMVLMGSKTGDELRIRAEVLNYHSAALSDYAFFCSRTCGSFEKLQNVIGTLDALVTDEEISTIVKTTWASGLG